MAGSRILDGLAYLIAAVLAAVQAYIVVKGFVNLWRYPAEALATLRICCDLCKMAAIIGFLACWAAVTSGKMLNEEGLKTTKESEKPIQQRLLDSGPFGMSFMPGGLAPRLLLTIIAMLMLVTGTFVNASAIDGTHIIVTDMDSLKFVLWLPDTGCRADDALPATYIADWFSRLRVKDPTGCYGAGGKEGEGRAFYTRPTATTPGFQHPLVDVISPNGTVIGQKEDTTKSCFYQCASWKKVSVQALLKIGGVLAAGSAFLEKLALAITTRLGLKLINDFSDEADLELAIRYTLQQPRLPQATQRLLPILLFLLMLYLMDIYAANVDVDGYFTVDYYITLLFFLSLAVGLINRNFHLSKFNRMVFTENLWKNGKDMFRGLDTGGFIEIDLYEWFHVTPRQRAAYLLQYAQEVGPKEVSKMKTYSPLGYTEDEGKGNADSKPQEGKEIGETWQSLNNLKTRLLQVERSISRLEGGPEAGVKAMGDVEDIEDKIVTCKTRFVVFVDIWVPNFIGSRDGKFHRRRIVVHRGAEGIVRGKSPSNHLMVTWKNHGIHAEYVDIQDGSKASAGQDDLEEKAVKVLTFETDPKFVSECSTDFQLLQEHLQKLDGIPRVVSIKKVTSEESLASALAEDDGWFSSGDKTGWVLSDLWAPLPDKILDKKK
jgi:hypothetical protein